jgi:2-desacetyl-2-hydroxyethyl bacteriochlorophyllide A dehydrogenase
VKAVVLLGPADVSVTDVSQPAADGRALVQVQEAGVCGTDLKIFDGAVVVDYPRILGHEAAGEVVRPGARGLLPPGARVLIDPTVTCGHCLRCRADEMHLCTEGGLMGRDLDGVFAQYAAVDELQLHQLPDGVSPAQAPLLQVLGTCVHAQTLVGVDPLDTAVVVGLGVTGLLHLQLLQIRGAGQLIGVTRSTEKLRLAEKLGATAVATPADAAAAVGDLTGGVGADLVVESSGTVSGLRTAVRVARPGGTVLVFGTISATSGDFPYYLLYIKELALISSRGARPRDYAAAIDLVSSGRVRLDPLLSGRYPFEQAAEALERFRVDPGVLKVTLSVADTDRATQERTGR